MDTLLNSQFESEEAVPEKIRSLSMVSQVLALLGGLVIIFFLLQAIYTAIFASAEYDEMLNFAYAELVDEREFNETVLNNSTVVNNPKTYSISMRISVMLLSFATYLWGGFALYLSWQLFRGYGQGKIFSPVSAKRLSRVGWTVLLLSPVGILARYYQIKAIMFSSSPLDFLISYGSTDLAILSYVGIDHFDIYAVVLGLLIVMVGRIIEEAARIADENKSFV